MCEFILAGFLVCATIVFLIEMIFDKNDKYYI